jgi:hypothetical protein
VTENRQLTAGSVLEFFQYAAMKIVFIHRKTSSRVIVIILPDKGPRV